MKFRDRKRGFGENVFNDVQTCFLLMENLPYDFQTISFHDEM